MVNNGKKSKKRAAPRIAVKVTAAKKKKKNLAGRTRRVIGMNNGMLRQMASKGLTTKQLKVDTMDGLKWALAALHPCNEQMTEAVAYPDNATMATHCTRMQRTVTISPPGAKCSVNPQPEYDACSWNLMIITTPWAEYPWMVCATQGNSEPPGLAKWLQNPDYHMKNGDDKTSPGVTAWDTWTFFSFPNFMDASKFGTSNVDANDTRKKYTKLRVIGKGTTTYLNASRLYDGGRVICGQYPVASRYIDTFNPDSVSLDTEALLDKLISRLCVEGSVGTPDVETIRAMTDHTHTGVGKVNIPVGADEDQEPKPDIKQRLFVNRDEHGCQLNPRTGTAYSVTVPHKDFDHRHQVNLSGSNDGGSTVSVEGISNYVRDQGMGPSTTSSTYSIDASKPIAGTITLNALPVSVLGQDEEGDVVELYNMAGDCNVTTGRPIYQQQGTKQESVPHADSCLKITKKGESLTNVKLIRDGDVKDAPNWLISEPPHYETQLYYGDAKATTWEARNGTYQVMRLINMELDDVATGTATFYDLNDPYDTEVVPENYSYTYSVNHQGTGTWGVAYYRNINTMTSVTLKCVQYAQGEVNPTGPYANLQPLHVDPDQSAIALVTEEQRRLAHAYPARYNDLGQILGQVFNVAKAIGKTVGTVAGSLHDTPIVGELAKGITGVLNTLGLG